MPDDLLEGLAARFAETGEPRDLTFLFAAGQGDGKDRGLNRLSGEGLLKRVVGGHWGLIPKIGALATSGKIEAYNLPQGCISHLYRDIAAGKPGTFSKVGLGTFVDPRHGGGKINGATPEDLVELVEAGGEELLFYKAFPINVALIRGTTADPSGNISMEREALTLDNLAMAMAARNSHGIVIAQVERIAQQGSLSPRQVVIPGALVDCVVVARSENHHQTYATAYSPAYSGEIAVPLESVPPMVMSPRKVIARRCAMELPPNGVVNLGIGMPRGSRPSRRRRTSRLHHADGGAGVVGGMPASGLDFGAAEHGRCFASEPAVRLLRRWGLDLACLGMAECDASGHINVSRFGPKLAGAGGFINISQNARRVVFAGTFTAGGLDAAVSPDGLEIRQEGRSRKFIDAVEQITFNGRLAAERGQSVLYVTERCVFALSPEGPVLTEIAPGVDLERDILSQMDFVPAIDGPSPMDLRIFGEDPMGLKDRILDIRLEDRISYDADRNILFPLRTCRSARGGYRRHQER